MSKLVSLTLLTKPGCHLCDDARNVVNQALLELAEVNSANVQIELLEINILEDEKLLEQYVEEIPVLQINGSTHAYWRVDPLRLRTALSELLTN